jgi:L-asparaginase
MNEKRESIRPRIIIHGGAGNITPDTITPDKLAEYKQALLRILKDSYSLLQKDGATALDVAVHAVTLFEDDPLFNAGKGAVFTRAGTNELEASVMVSSGHIKRGVGCILLSRVKHPIQLAKEMLIRGDDADLKGGGAQGHCALSGPELEKLAEKWGCEMVDPGYFWTKERWDQHKRGLEKEQNNTIGTTASWDRDEYVPQGTVGAVVLDSFGTIAVATSTGGLTNKLSGRIGDTPTIGAGFWAEEWIDEESSKPIQTPPILDSLSRGDVLSVLKSLFGFKEASIKPSNSSIQRTKSRHAVAISGTGNGDSFLRLSASHAAAAISKYSSPKVSLAEAVARISGPGGELQKSAGDRWHTGEGEAGMIGVELIENKGYLACDFNRGMFRSYVDEEDNFIFGAFRDKE